MRSEKNSDILRVGTNSIKDAGTSLEKKIKENLRR